MIIVTIVLPERDVEFEGGINCFEPNRQCVPLLPPLLLLLLLLLLVLLLLPLLTPLNAGVS